jgi:hypothetical protein
MLRRIVTKHDHAVAVPRIPRDTPVTPGSLRRQVTNPDCSIGRAWPAASRAPVSSLRTSRGAVVPLRADLDGGGRKRC